MNEVDMRDVEKYQKQSLGRFYYKNLAYGTKEDKINLAMFGQGTNDRQQQNIAWSH